MFGIKNALTAVVAALVVAFALGCASGAEPAQPQPPALAAPAPTAMPIATPRPSQPNGHPAPYPPREAEPAPTAAPLIPMHGDGPAPMPTTPPWLAAAEPSPTPIPAVFPYSVTDANGDEVVFDKPAERVVAFSSAAVEALFAIGEGERVVATHSFVSYPPEADSVARVGDAFNMDIEAIVALEPDLVYIFFGRFEEDLERAGLKTLHLATLSDDFPEIADRVRMWGRIAGNPTAAERVAADFERQVQEIEDAMRPIAGGPVVFQNSGGYWTPGSGTLMQEVFDLLKLENAAADIEGYAQLSPEVIVEKDPTIIITSDPDEFYNDPAFANVRAVRNRAVISLPSDSLSIAGPRFMDGVEELARLVYLGLFR